MILYIAEKNTLAETLCTHLSSGRSFKKHRFHYEGDNYVMTACLGHTMELCDASEYRSDWAGPWNLTSLPILPDEMQYRPIDSKKERLSAILALCKKATRIIHCGDPDREGQYLVDNVIAASGFSGEVYRWWPDDLSETGLEKSFKNILPNKQYEPLGIAAKYRSWADWIVGINFTRLYTLASQSSGHQDTISIGRVQTPTFALVHNRCLEIENFKPTLHYGLNTTFKTRDGQEYTGIYQLPDDLVDDNGYCKNRNTLESISSQLNGKTGAIEDVNSKRKEEKAPLPYSLSTLQDAAGKQWGYTLKEVLSTVQYLYEELKALTYPRTDCRYLSEGDFSSSQKRVEAIQAFIETDINTDSLSFSTMPRCFNDKQTTAHTAIVPTTTKVERNVIESIKLSDLKSRGIPDKDALYNIYEMCAHRFIQQFMHPKVTDETLIYTSINKLVFKTSLKTVLNPGWVVLEYSSAAAKGKDDNDESGPTTVNIKNGDQVDVVGSEIKDKKTSPPEYFTEGSLGVAMANIAKYVNDPEIKKRLKETDGIGTEATRTTIVERLKSIGVIAPVNGKLKTTSLGRTLYPSIPPFFKTPTMTAIWEKALDGISEGKVDHNSFYNNICTWTANNIEKLKAAPPVFEFKNVVKYPCQDCNGSVIKRKGKYGSYWACCTDGCNTTYPDFNKGPLYPVDGHGEICTECGEGVMKTRASKGDPKRGKLPKVFLSCSLYPKCKHSIWDIDKRA